MREIKIACIGDSITFGSGVRGFRWKNSYPSILGKMMGKGVKVYNFGLSGRTLTSTGDMPYIKESKYKESLRLQAGTYIIMLGTNDSKPYNWNESGYKKEIREFILTYKNLDNKPRIIVMQPCKCFPVIGGVVSFDIKNETVKNKINPIIEDTARDLDVEVIDLYNLTLERPDWFIDGVHPNKKGNHAIAEAICKAMAYGKKSAEK
ncbi:MAG: GDSL-type esterase/lipase family protein [Suipraeoptans sp.]